HRHRNDAGPSRLKASTTEVMLKGESAKGRTRPTCAPSLLLRCDSGRRALLREQALDDPVACLKRLAELLRLWAAALCHVGFAAAAPADHRREFLYDLSGGDSTGEVG